MHDDTNIRHTNQRSRLIRRWSLIGMACAGIAATGWYVVADPQHFVIEKVRLTGQFSHVDIDTLKPRIASQLRGNFFTLDLDVLRADLRTVPWIKYADVQRRWPGELHIAIRERQPIARWEIGGALDNDGELFQPDTATLDTELPVIAAPEGLHQTVAKKLLELNAYLRTIDAQVARLDVDARRAYRLTLRDGTQLLLGRKDMELRLARYTRAFARLTDEQRRHIVRVDLRYNNGFAMSRSARQQG